MAKKLWEVKVGLRKRSVDETADETPAENG
jgi:hypothetical protein